MSTPSVYLPVLQTGRWFAHLPPDFAQPLIAMAQLRLLPTGEVLFRRGDAPCGLYAVVRGAVSISGTGGRADEARAALAAHRLLCRGATVVAGLTVQAAKAIPDLAKVKVGISLVGGFPSLTLGFDGLDSFAIGKVFTHLGDAWASSAEPGTMHAIH